MSPATPEGYRFRDALHGARLETFGDRIDTELQAIVSTPAMDHPIAVEGAAMCFAGGDRANIAELRDTKRLRTIGPLPVAELRETSMPPARDRAIPSQGAGVPAARCD